MIETNLCYNRRKGAIQNVLKQQNYNDYCTRIKCTVVGGFFCFTFVTNYLNNNFVYFTKCILRN